MNNQENCQNRREAITALVLGVLDAKDTEELQKHIDSCQVCKSLYKELTEEEESIRPAFKVIAERGEMLQSSLIEQFGKSEQTAVKRNEEAGKTIKIQLRNLQRRRQ
jgi:anti-sigma factor RsiW